MPVTFFNWQAGKQPGAPFNKCSPNLLAIVEELGKRFGGYSLGCYGKRPIRNGVAWSSHSFGAAHDWRIDDDMQRAKAIDWLILNHETLGVQAIHDYVGSRIWHSDRQAWKAQPKSSNGMGQAWAKYLHIETNVERWGDDRPVSVRLGSKPGDTSGLIDDATPAVPTPLRKGVVDAPRVRWLQQILNERFGASLGVDGGFGDKTHAAVVVMQQILDAQPNVTVAQDGVYGQQTAGALAAWLAAH